jgi:hypothetical protein
MLADYCWTLVRETPTDDYEKQNECLMLHLFFRWILYTDTIFTFLPVYSNFKNILIFLNVVFEFKPFSLKGGR